MEFQRKVVGMLFVLMFSTLSAHAQFTEKKVIQKKSVFSTDGRISISNKHGFIQLNSWDKDSIRVKIEILGSSKSLEKLNTMMDRTNIISHVNRDFADFTTEIDENIISKEWKNIKSIAGYAGEQIKVNYYVWVPKTCRLKISLEFGNLYMTDHSGVLDIQMDHGDLRAGELPGLDFASLDFVNAYIKSVGQSSIAMTFGDLDLRAAGYLKLDSKASGIDIREVEKLQMASTRDDVELGKVGEVNVISSLSKFEINQLSKSVEMELKYGQLRIEHILPSCDLVSLKPSRCSVDLSFDEGCSFVVDGHGEELEVVYEQGLGTLSSSSVSIKGTIGTGTASKKLYIYGNNSSISFNKNY